MVPHRPISFKVPVHSLLTLLLYMWGFHLITIQAHLQPGSSGILILTNLPIVFLFHWNINP